MAGNWRPVVRHALGAARSVERAEDRLSGDDADQFASVVDRELAEVALVQHG